MAQAAKDSPTGSTIELEFQLKPVALVATRFDGPVKSDGSRDSFKTSSETSRDPKTTRLAPGDRQPMGLKAFALAFVRAKHCAEVGFSSAKPWTVLSGPPGSPAFTLAGVLKDTRVDTRLDWVRKFCGCLEDASKPGVTRCALADYFDVENFPPGKGGLPIEIQFKPADFRAVSIGIRIFGRPKTEPATLAELLRIAKALAGLPDWTARDQVEMPAKRPGPTEAESGERSDRPLDAGKLKAYRRAVADECMYVLVPSLSTQDSDRTRQRKLQLDNVYVHLDTTTQRPVETLRHKDADALSDARRMEKAERLSALQACASDRRAVLLGAPGSGKSTLVRYLSLCLANHGFKPNGSWLKKLPGWPKPESELLPILVSLREFAKAHANETSKSADAGDLWEFIEQHVLRQYGQKDRAQILKQAIEDGQGILFFDGLDEVPNNQREFVRDAVQSFAAAPAFSTSRMIVTCRIRSYRDRAAQWRLDGFAEHELASLHPEKIKTFAQGWYQEQFRAAHPRHELTPEGKRDADVLTDSLLTAIRDPARKLSDLAGNPMLLTVMAQVHNHRRELPRQRAKIYEHAVNLLLDEWDFQRFKGTSGPKGLHALLEDERVGKEMAAVKERLQMLAFQSRERSQRQNSKEVAEITADELKAALLPLHKDNKSEDPDQKSKASTWAENMVAAMEYRAGLLISPAPGRFTFPHPSFQEYLAGVALVNHLEFVKEACALAEAGAYWSEVILWAAGWQAHVCNVPRERGSVRTLAESLCGKEGDPSSCSKAVLASQVVREMGVDEFQEIDLNGDTLKRIRDRLTTLLGIKALPPVERASAGEELGKLGDPRPSVISLPASESDKDFWIEIPKGEFIMGGKEDWQGGREFPCQLLEKHSYKISRYPITVAQFQAFVDAGGYEQERFWSWSKAAKEWLEGITREWRKEGKQPGPENYDPVFQTPNHPRVGVSWFEAAAFCRWLSEKLKLDIRLPSEAEWERAARGTQGRPYPWGKQTNLAQRCNMAGTGINHTSAVGLFPSGDTKPGEPGNTQGVADMAGNVWEWCRTDWLSDYEDYERKVSDDPKGDSARVLRGGSWVYDGPRGLSPSCRYGSTPDRRDYFIGFRVVLVGASAR